MELAEELSFRRCELKLQWIRRDINQVADDLTNENFDPFDTDLKVNLIGGDLEWRVLHKLLKGADAVFQEVRFHIKRQDLLGSRKEPTDAGWILG